MAFFELDDVFTYQDANDIKKLWAGDTAPTGPGTGEVWLDTSAIPSQLKRYNGTGWDIVGEIVSPLTIKTTGENSQIVLERTDGATGEIMGGNSGVAIGSITNHPVRFVVQEDVKMVIDTNGNIGIGTTTPAAKLDVEGEVKISGNTVWHAGNDGSGSGLDADKLDGLESGSFLRSDTDDTAYGRITFRGGVLDWSVTYAGCLEVRSPDSGTPSFICFHIPGTFAAYLGIDTDGKWKVGGWSMGTDVKHEIWHAGNDGSGSGLDADKLDGQEGSYYRNADNLNAGTVARARLSDLWHDNDYDTNENVFIQTGSKYCTVAGTNVFFDYAFSEIPRVVGICVRKDRGIAYITSRTTTYFKGSMSETGASIDWIAIGRKD